MYVVEQRDRLTEKANELSSFESDMFAGIETDGDADDDCIL